MAEAVAVRPLIETRGVRREFVLDGGERVLALDGVDIEVHDKEFVCLLGPSGCGKSTWLRLVAGLDEPTTGEILYKGEPVKGPGRERGMVFQEYSLLPWRTVAENVALGPEFNGAGKRERREMAMDYLARVGLEKFADAKPHELSGGMRQRAAIARALANDPEVLLMDEPFGALDAQTRTQLQSELLQTWERDMKTCFFITHDVDEAIILAQKVIVMSARPGRVKAVIDIDIPYPRDQETKMSPRFLELKNEIWSLVYQEYLEVRK